MDNQMDELYLKEVCVKGIHYCLNYLSCVQMYLLPIFKKRSQKRLTGIKIACSSPSISHLFLRTIVYFFAMMMRVNVGLFWRSYDNMDLPQDNKLTSPNHQLLLIMKCRKWSVYLQKMPQASIQKEECEPTQDYRKVSGARNVKNLLLSERDYNI